jgi:hypothetical protein
LARFHQFFAKAGAVNAKPQTLELWWILVEAARFGKTIFEEKEGLRRVT